MFVYASTVLKELRAEAQRRKLYNFFMPEVSNGLSVLEYAHIAEMLGAVPLANLAMNAMTACSAPLSCTKSPTSARIIAGKAGELS